MTDVARLENRDYTLILDKSMSMQKSDCNGRSRWEAARESTEGIAERLHKLDPDGITLYTFSGNFKRYDNIIPSKVEKIFLENEPMGSTDLAAVLKHAFNSYKDRKKAGTSKNGEIFAVVTDGEPDDEKAVVKEIVAFTKTLDRADEVGITILQIGKDPGAAKFLKRLDDDLVSEGAKHDIVDTKTFEELENMSFTDVLHASLTD